MSGLLLEINTIGKSIWRIDRENKGMGSITERLPNHWVEKDATDRASHPRRSADAHTTGA